MSTILFRPLLICVCFSFSCFAQAPANAPSPRKKPVPTVKMASWNEQAEKSFGVSHEDFASMGFSKLTQGEYGLVLAWIAAKKQEAKLDGMAAAQAATLTYSCGLSGPEEANASKVNLFIVDEKDNPSALMSGIRQRLRSISDVQIVYDEKDADLRISVIAFENELKGSNMMTGYSAAVITTTPCTSKFGTNEGTFHKFEHVMLQTGGKDVNPIVEDIVTTLDSKVIEPMRQEHAQMKKLLQEKKN